MYEDLITRFNSGRHTKIKWARFKALINCLSPEDTCQCIVEMLATSSDIVIRDGFTQKLQTDVVQDGWHDYHTALVRSLLTTFRTASTTSKQQHASVCGGIASLEQLPTELRREIVECLLSSDFSSIRSYGYHALQERGATECAAAIEQAWVMYGDPLCARLIVKHLPSDIQNQHFDTLWQLDDSRTTIPLFLHAELTPERLTALRQADGITYAYVCAKRGIIISYDEATELWKKHSSDERAGLLIWAFGKMGLKYVLEQLDLSPRRVAATKHNDLQLADSNPMAE